MLEFLFNKFAGGILKNTHFEEHLCTVASNYGNLAMFFEKICHTEKKRSTILSRVNLLF